MTPAQADPPGNAGRHDQQRRPVKVVAFGGGHGLAASLRALRRCAPELDVDITAVVTVGDNGGSSGRLRAERDAQLPPGDLRMALAALADDDPAHQVMVRLMQHRFAPVGNPDRRDAAAQTRGAGRGVAGEPQRAAAVRPDAAEGAEPRLAEGAVAVETRVAETAAAAEPGMPEGAAPVEPDDRERAVSIELDDRERAVSQELDDRLGADSRELDDRLGAVSAEAPATEGSGGKAGWGGVDRRIASVGGKHDPLAGHAVGNLLLLGLLELTDDPVEALRHAGAMVGAQGRVLPMACHAVGIEADVRGGDPARPGEVVTVRGQHAVAVASGHVEAVRIVPASPPACPAALEAIAEADWLIFGPGSWYTSVLPHLLVPELADAIVASPARRLVTLNLAADNETLGLSVADHLAALHWYLPELHVDTVLADAKWVGEPDPVHRAAEALGARLVLAPLAVADGSPKHDPEALGAALVPVLGSDR